VTWPRFVAFAWVIVAGAVAIAYFGASPAFAQATYATECPEAPPTVEPGGVTDAAYEGRFLRIENAQACAAIAERIETLVAIAEASSESETTTAAQRVALAPIDRNRLDLMWWGVWATLGTIWAAVGGTFLLRAFRFWAE
jgi:hypothetical protein